MTELRRVDVKYADSPNLDAFSRLRVSDSMTVFDSTFQYDVQPLIYYTKTANGGTVTHSPDISSVTLTLDGTASGEATIQSKEYHKYVPGKSHLIVMTQVLGAATASVVKRVGYFDDDDGIFLEQNGTTDVAVVRRTSTSGSPVNNRVVQADWNQDKLDGSGPSGITLDLSKAALLLIDLQWLGSGRVRIGFGIDGHVVYCHEFLSANILILPYLKTGNLPNRWEMTGDAAETMIATCCSIQSEGGTEGFAYVFAYDRASITAANGSQTHAFSIRPKALFNSITNRAIISPFEFACLVTGNSPVLVEVYYNTTVGGAPSWGDMDASFSALQVDTAGTPSGGLKVHSFFIPATNQARGAVSDVFTHRYPLTLDMPGTGFTNMTIYVEGQGGTSACRPGVLWREVR